MNAPRYTTLGLFAVSVAPTPNGFLVQGSVPKLHFVLSASRDITVPLAVARELDFSFSMTRVVNFTLGV